MSELVEVAMRSAQFRSSLLVAVVGLMCASSADAQQPVSSLEELRILANTGSKVTVTDGSGQQFRGTVDDASEAQLSLQIDGAIHRFAAAEVRSVRVRKEDSVVNGALIGAAIGGGLTASALFLDNECRDDPLCYEAVAFYAGIGALAGLGIDALIHRDVVVYTAPPPSSERTFTLTPIAARGRGGVRITIAF